MVPNRRVISSTTIRCRYASAGPLVHPGQFERLASARAKSAISRSMRPPVIRSNNTVAVSDIRRLRSGSFGKGGVEGCLICRRHHVVLRHHATGHGQGCWLARSRRAELAASIRRDQDRVLSRSAASVYLEVNPGARKRMTAWRYIYRCIGDQYVEKKRLSSYWLEVSDTISGCEWFNLPIRSRISAPSYVHFMLSRSELDAIRKLEETLAARHDRPCPPRPVAVLLR